MDTPLSPQAWAEVFRLFDEALDMPEAARPAWLARMATQDAATARQLSAMLAAHADEAATARLERGPQLAQSTDSTDPALAPGRRVGPWQLVAPLGSGGMATVWRATRADGAYQREVALKLPLRWQPDRAAAERFERECDILARLEHPHIARLYDANLGDSALPWLAIEQVDGLPLDRWCEQQRLSLRQRLALFIQVLEAVHHAHSHLVLHRDLKASNILVTAQGQVKLLDFGIATLMQASMPADTAALAPHGQRVMTPAFAAPEQVENGPLTTATDIYAAGVVLFDLLTGARPYRGDTQTPAQLESAILQGDLQRASQACTAAAASSTGLSLAELRQQLAGDIDAVLATALQRDPARRYTSALAFANDLQRHLARLPLLARPHTPSYVLGKFVARHRALVLLACGATLCLAGAASVAAWQAHLAQQQSARAQVAQTANETSSLFMADLLNDAMRAGKPIQADEWLARAERMARQSFANKPDQLARVLWLVSQRASDWGGQERSRSLLREALALAQDKDMREHLSCEDAFAQAQLGELAVATQRLQAIANNSQALPVVRTCAYGNLAFMAGQGGRLAEALALQERAMAQMAQASVFPDHLRAANTARMALFKGEAGQGSEADRLFQRALDRMTASGRERSLAAWTVRNEWSVALSAAGNARQALQQVEDNLRLADTDIGFTPQLLYAHRSLGLMQLTLGRFAQAQATFESSLEKAAAGGGETAEMVRAITCDKALVATRSGRLDTAAQALAQADKVPRRASASDAFYDRGCRMVRAEFDIARGAADQGLAAVQAVLAGPGGQSPALQGSARVLATKAHLALAQPAAAVAQAEQALALARKLQSDRPHSYRTGTAGMWLGAAQAAAGQREQARATLAQAIEQLQGSVDDQHPWLEETRRKLAALGPAAGATR